MNWHGLWFHMDSLVHVIGSHYGLKKRTVYADCGVMLCGLIVETPIEYHTFVSSNTLAKYPTCLACWHQSNFGTYAPRP